MYVVFEPVCMCVLLFVDTFMCVHVRCLFHHSPHYILRMSHMWIQLV